MGNSKTNKQSKPEEFKLYLERAHKAHSIVWDKLLLLLLFFEKPAEKANDVVIGIEDIRSQPLK